VFHVQLYTRLHQARVYNLDENELQRQFLDPMRSPGIFVYEGHEWEPRKTQLSVYETDDRLRPDQIAMGRGWSNVEKIGNDVTMEALARRPAPGPSPGSSVAVALLKERLIGRLSAGAVTLQEIMAMAADLMPESDVNEQVAASHRAASELLHTGSACLAPLSAIA
jgi:hypothetical protein